MPSLCKSRFPAVLLPHFISVDIYHGKKRIAILTTSSYIQMMNTVDTWTKLDGMSLWSELVKNAEITLEQLLYVFCDTVWTNSLFDVL